MKLNKAALLIIVLLLAIVGSAFAPPTQPYVEIYVNGKLVDKDALTMKIGDSIRLKIHNEGTAKYRFDSVVLFFIPDVGGQAGYLEGNEPTEKKVVSTSTFEKSPSLKIDYASIQPRRGGIMGFRYTRLIVRLVRISKQVGKTTSKADDITLNEYSFFKPDVKSFIDGKGLDKIQAH